MSDLLTISLLIGLVVAAGAVIALTLRQRQSAQREAFQALAARRGWSLTISEQKLGRPAVLRLTARSGHGWTAQARRIVGGNDGHPPAQTTEFDAAEPAWPEGLLIIGPALPATDPERPSAILATLDSPEGQSFLARFMGEDVAKYGAVLRHFPVAPNITVLATTDPAHRVDFTDVAKLVAAWAPQIRGEKGQPILILGPDGMRLRLRHGTKRADHMERFIDLALDLSRIL